MASKCFDFIKFAPLFTFSVMGQTANMLGFVNCMVFIATAHFYHCYLEATTENI